MKKIAMAAALLALTAGAQAQEAGTNASISFSEPKLYVTGKSPEPPTMGALMADQIKGNSLTTAASIPTIRAEAIQETAAGVGARAGMARRLRDYALSLEKMQSQLDADYDFTKLTLPVAADPSKSSTKPTSRAAKGEFAMILPAVLLDGRDADSAPNENEIRIAERIYTLHAKERLVPVDKKSGRPVVPTWRDYLVMSFPQVQMPHASLLPQNDAEKALWNAWVQDGWRKGQEQADAMYLSGSSRLERDYHGMVKGLLANREGRLSVTRVAGLNMGVTGGGNNMRINDRVIRIVDHAGLVADPKKWTESADKE